MGTKFIGKVTRYDSFHGFVFVLDHNNAYGIYFLDRSDRFKVGDTLEVTAQIGSYEDGRSRPKAVDFGAVQPRFWTRVHNMKVAHSRPVTAPPVARKPRARKSNPQTLPAPIKSLQGSVWKNKKNQSVIQVERFSYHSGSEQWRCGVSVVDRGNSLRTTTGYSVATLFRDFTLQPLGRPSR